MRGFYLTTVDPIPKGAIFIGLYPIASYELF